LGHEAKVAKAAQSFLEFPPMQAGASFNMSALKAELEQNSAAPPTSAYADVER
jgi:hypothetical protein